MTAVATTVDPLAFYASIGAALFPIPEGQKAPTGIVKNFTTDNSTDPAQWARWRAAHPGCNFGVVAGASKIITVDIDAAKHGREKAWAAWCKLCAEWGLPSAPMPHVQSARGGWHILFRCDLPDLRQPSAVHELIDIRAGNGYTVAAGSTFQGGHYMIINDAAPYPA